MAHTSDISGEVLILFDVYDHLVLIRNINTSYFDAAEGKKNKPPLWLMDANYSVCQCVGGVVGAAGRDQVSFPSVHQSSSERYRSVHANACLERKCHVLSKYYIS